MLVTRAATTSCGSGALRDSACSSGRARRGSAAEQRSAHRGLESGTRCMEIDRIESLSFTALVTPRLATSSIPLVVKLQFHFFYFNFPRRLRTKMRSRSHSRRLCSLLKSSAAAAVPGNNSRTRSWHLTVPRQAQSTKMKSRRKAETSSPMYESVAKPAAAFFWRSRGLMKGPQSETRKETQKYFLT